MGIILTVVCFVVWMFTTVFGGMFMHMVLSHGLPLWGQDVPSIIACTIFSGILMAVSITLQMITK